MQNLGHKRQTMAKDPSAFANKLDFDHPDSVDMPLFAAVSYIFYLISTFHIDIHAKCLADLKACRQTNIPIYSFTHHQRLDETKVSSFC